MNIRTKKRFLKKIKTETLFFFYFQRDLTNIEYFKKKYDPFLLLTETSKRLFENSQKNQIKFFEVEFTILPSVKPNIEILFMKNQLAEKFDSITGLKVFWSKKANIFCTGFLPIFKCRKTFQCEILKIDIFSGKVCKRDRIFSKELAEEKEFHKQRSFFLDLPYQWKTKFQHYIFFNGFLNLKKFIFYSIRNLYFRCFSCNNCLVRLNFGPEFRFNFRY